MTVASPAATLQVRGRDKVMEPYRASTTLTPAQYYGPDVANELIREALHPYPDNLVLGRDRRVDRAAGPS